MRHGNTRIKLEQTEEKITAQSGLGISFEEIYQGMGIGDILEKTMPKPGSNKGYEAEVFIKPILATLMGGGETIEDIKRLNEDGTLANILNLETVPVGQSYSEWLRRIGSNERSFDQLGESHRFIKHQVLRVLEIKLCTLDIDASEIISEKASAKYTYKKNQGYMPMLGFLKEVPICIAEEFREGNDVPCNRNTEFVIHCKNQMPEDVKINKLRIDSAGYQADVINECEKEEYPITFYIGASLDSAVKKAILNIPEDSWISETIENGKETGRQISETIHCMEKTNQAFRLIVQRWIPKDTKESLDQSLLFEEVFYKYHVIATNSIETAKEVISFYNGRGQEENYNKEVKNGFSMKRMPCDDFKANAVWFRLGVMAYNLFIALKWLVLPEEWKPKTIKSVRWLLFQIAGKWVCHSRQYILKLSGISREILTILINIQRKCYDYRHSFT